MNQQQNHYGPVNGVFHAGMRGDVPALMPQIYYCSTGVAIRGDMVCAEHAYDYDMSGGGGTGSGPGTGTSISYGIKQ